jgi:hypothetical protein
VQREEVAPVHGQDRSGVLRGEDQDRGVARLDARKSGFLDSHYIVAE